MRVIRHETIEQLRNAADVFDSAKDHPVTKCGTRWIALDWAAHETALLNAARAIVPDRHWKSFKDGKRQFSDVHRLPADLRSVFEEMQSVAFVGALRQLSGIPDLSPDTDFLGAGLHATPRGGSLGIHVDFNQHRDGRYRRLNVFLFLGNGSRWETRWGAPLELWDASGKEASIEIYPAFNTLAIFESTDSSWHGQPDPCKCPEGEHRLSLALYYYSASRPDSATEKHSTIYK